MSEHIKTGEEVWESYALDGTSNIDDKWVSLTWLLDQLERMIGASGHSNWQVDFIKSKLKEDK